MGVAAVGTDSKTYPGVDVRTARSRLIDENRIAAEDVTLARTAKDTIATARRAEDHSELARDLVLIDRARKLRAFFSQPFYVAEPFTKRPGSHLSRADALRGCPRNPRRPA
jgi:F-type H+-transporting ATPase subunit beta